MMMTPVSRREFCHVLRPAAVLLLPGVSNALALLIKDFRPPTLISDSQTPVHRMHGETMNALINILAKSGLLTKDLDYHLIRASMVLIFLAFGYQKWWPYEAQVLIPYISNGPLIFWMYPVFGIRGASWFLGVSEWLFGALLFLGFWNKRLGVLGAIGSTVTFLMTVTIIPFMPNGWDPVAGFPAMAGNVPFLMKDVVLLAVSIYLLKQDVVRVLKTNPSGSLALGWQANAIRPTETA
jgi:uncharacterized membrane protein YkgB